MTKVPNEGCVRDWLQKILKEPLFLSHYHEQMMSNAIVNFHLKLFLVCIVVASFLFTIFVSGFYVSGKEFFFKGSMNINTI